MAIATISVIDGWLWTYTSIPITLGRGDHLLHSQLSKLNLKIELCEISRWLSNMDTSFHLTTYCLSPWSLLHVKATLKLCIGSYHWLYFQSTNQWRAYQLYNVVIGTPNICAGTLHHLILINTLILIHVSRMLLLFFYFSSRIELYSELKRLYIVNSLKVCPNWKKLLYDYNGYLFLE